MPPVGHEHSRRLLAIGLTASALTACVMQPRKPSMTSRTRLSDYKGEHYASVPSFGLGRATYDDLDQALLEGRLMLVGDVHDDMLLHERIHALVERSAQLAKRARARLRVFVEFIGLEDEARVAAWLRSDDELETLRAALRRRWPESWLEGARGIHAAFYRRLLGSARQLDFDLRALEPVPRLALDERDLVMATVLQRARQEAKKTIDLVIVGHAHLLGRDHLVDALGDEGARAVVILPDIEEAPAHGAPLSKLDEGLYRWTRAALPTRR